MPAVRAIVRELDTDHGGSSPVVIARANFCGEQNNAQIDIAVMATDFGNVSQLQIGIAQAVVDRALADFGVVLQLQDVLMPALTQG